MVFMNHCLTSKNFNLGFAAVADADFLLNLLSLFKQSSGG